MPKCLKLVLYIKTVCPAMRGREPRERSEARGVTVNELLFLKRYYIFIYKLMI